MAKACYLQGIGRIAYRPLRLHPLHLSRFLNTAHAARRTNRWHRHAACIRGTAGKPRIRLEPSPSSWIHPRWPHMQQVRRPAPTPTQPAVSDWIGDAVVGNIHSPSYSTESIANSRRDHPHRRRNDDTGGRAMRHPLSQRRSAQRHHCRSDAPDQCSCQSKAVRRRRQGTDRRSTLCKLVVENSTRRLHWNDLCTLLKHSSSWQQPREEQ